MPDNAYDTPFPTDTLDAIHADGRRTRKHGTPFRLGTTSFVLPASLIRNVEYLAPLVDDIELILWELDGESNFPDDATIGAMYDAARAHNVTFTVHLPQDLRIEPGGSSPSLDIARRVIQLTAPLDPRAYVFHLDGEGTGTLTWANQARQAAAHLIDEVESPSLLALENLEGYDPVYLTPIIEEYGLSATVDVGHLWKTYKDPRRLLRRWLPRARAVHLHGFDGDRDHLSLRSTARRHLDQVMRALRGYRGVVTLEVFNVDDFKSSRDALLESWGRVAPR